MGAKKTKLLVAELPLAGAEHDSLEQFRAAGIELDPEYPPERPDLRRAWERVKLMRKARKTLASGMKRESGLARGRKGRCRLCGEPCDYRDWKFDVLTLNAGLLAQQPKRSDSWRYRQIRTELNAVQRGGGKLLTDSSIKLVITNKRHKEDRDYWLANRTAIMAMPSHLSAVPA